MGARTLLHVDLDAFYASVEQRDDPRLRGQPVVVGGHTRRGVVCAASYEARRFGIKSAMPMAQALKLCPHAVVIRPRMGHYADVSEQFFAVLERFTPLVEGMSLDEAYLDVTASERLFGDGAAIAARIKREVREELALVASVGVAPAKLVAKIASDLGKPDGLVVVAPGQVTEFLAPLPLWRLWGVGAVLEKSLRGLGLHTIGDVAAAGTALSVRIGREAAERLEALARGADDRPVVASRAAVSVGSEDTFDEDIRDRDALAVHLLAQADRVCARVRAMDKRARTVAIKVKYADHELVTRRRTLPRATADERCVGEVATTLLAAVPAIERRGVRLTGVTLMSLGDAAAPRQLDLDDGDVEKGEALGEVRDRIAERFGARALRRAVHLDE